MRHLDRGPHERHDRPERGRACACTATVRRFSSVPHAGWRVIAAKELGDHLLSVRFIVLLVVLGLAAAIPLYFAADVIRGIAPQASGVPAVFLALVHARVAGLHVPAGRFVRGHRGAAARPGLRVRRDQRRALGGNAAPAPRPAHLPRRRHQRQVRGRAGGHRRRPRGGRRHHRGLRHLPARHHARVG